MDQDNLIFQDLIFAFAVIMAFEFVPHLFLFLSA